MRLTDRRYDRDRQRLELAHRLLGYGVRTDLIRQLTGLSADRVRRLFRDYFHGGPVAARPRGPRPRQMQFFSQTLQRELEAATLASLLHGCQLLGKLKWTDLDRFCHAFDTFVEFCPGTEISFEHAWYLGETLALEKDHALISCSSCRALWIRDSLMLAPAVCPWCRWARSAHRLVKTPMTEVA